MAEKRGTGSGTGRLFVLPGRKGQRRVESLSQIRTYWEALCPAPGVIPARLAVQPRAIEGALHAALVLERAAPGVIRVRIAGRSLVEAMGREPRGLPLIGLFDLEAKAEALAAIEDVFTAPAIVEMDLGLPATGAKTRARLVLMPLTDYLGRVSMALGGFETTGAPMEDPGRFTVLGRRATALPEVRVTQPGCFALDGIRAVAEAPAPFRGAPRLVFSREAPGPVRD